MSDTEQALGYIFKDKQILRRALTLKGADEHFNNEALECLGDSLIGFVAAKKFYLDGLSEGGITARKKSVVNDRALTEVSVALGLDAALVKPKGGEGNKKAIPSAYEAVAAAIYLDGGMEEAESFILRTLNFMREERDYIALLQEALQGRRKPLPRYSHGIDEGRGEHYFKVKVEAEGKLFCGYGKNSSEAKRNAAKTAYLSLFATDGNE